MKTGRIYYCIKFLFVFLIVIYSQQSFGLYSWLQRADFGGGLKREQAFGFAIGSYGYAGCGKYTTDMNDFWQYDPANDTWTQMANYPGLGRKALAAFAIGNYGYAGTGWSGAGGGNNQHTDFWQYDPSNNTWTQKAVFPSAGRYSTVSFTIGNKGYLGLGVSPIHNDFWEYDPVLDQWNQKANFPSVRQAAVGIGVGNKGYVGTGYSGTTSYKDWYEFDPIANTWTQKSNVPGLRRRGAIAFNIGNYAFVGMGYNDSTYLTDFARYEPTTDSWEIVASIGGVPRYLSFAFAMDNYAYVGTGSYGGISVIIPTSELWRFQDCEGGGVGIPPAPEMNNEIYLSVKADSKRGLTIDYDLGEHNESIFTLYDQLGRIVLSTKLTRASTTKTITVSLNKEVYLYSVKENEKKLNSGKVVVF